ncbi:hypothetical protein CRDW_08350 [Chryseobacterium gambrini]|uniref:Uncharacterized protein n=1 Tax=Chryseobacterium gambrini TaxID=373672 RepID=A0ABN7CAT9_9FLAO|nr:hypothetical protein CRDW_08350 [Chryseobacterium gambrini]
MFFVESTHAFPATDFKNYYLRDEGQLMKYSTIGTPGCELLSKIIIFVMKDN